MHRYGSINSSDLPEVHIQNPASGTTSHVDVQCAVEGPCGTSRASHVCPECCHQSKRIGRHRCSIDDTMANEYSESDCLLSSSMSATRSVELQQSQQLNGSLVTSISSNASHCHDIDERSEVDGKAKKKLIIASLLCLIFMVGEMVGGLVAGSLAIISDAAHLLTDFASFMISLMALYLAQRRATKKLSFGWYRIEILGAFLSILMLWVLTGILCYTAVNRLIDTTYTINAEVMLITAASGVAFNIALGFTLHQSGHTHSHLGGGHSHGNHSHNSKKTDKNHSPNSHNGQTDEEKKRYGSINQENGNGTDYSRFKNPSEESEHGHSHKSKSNSKSNINVKAAFIHVIGDLCQSIGVLIAAFIIYFKPEWKMADPICTFLFSLFVIVTTVTILRDIVVVLMEGTPRHLVFGDIRDAFYEVEGIKDIHNLRVWSLTMNKIALSVHIAVYSSADPQAVLKMASAMIKERFEITETTMQLEEYVEEMLDCSRCQDLKD